MDGAREHDGIVERQQRDGPEVAAIAAKAQEAAEHQQRPPGRTQQLSRMQAPSLAPHALEEDKGAAKNTHDPEIVVACCARPEAFATTMA